MRIGPFNITNPVARRIVVWLIRSCAIVLLAAGARPATAVLIVPPTFAQFHQAPPNNVDTNVFQYIDNGPSGDAQLDSDHNGTAGGPIPVIFSFLSVTGTLPADLSGSQNATLTLTSSTIQSVQTAFGGAIGDQQILGDGTKSDTLIITRNAAAAEGSGSRTNLLTMTFTGQLLGAMMGGSPQLSGDTTIGPPYTITFQSDFLTFPGASKQFSLTFTSWSGGLQLSTTPGESLDTRLFFQAATANGTGTFAANAIAVPEPSTLTLGLIGLSVLLVGYRRKRRGQLCIP